MFKVALFMVTEEGESIEIKSSHDSLELAKDAASKLAQRLDLSSLVGNVIVTDHANIPMLGLEPDGTLHDFAWYALDISFEDITVEDYPTKVAYIRDTVKVKE